MSGKGQVHEALREIRIVPGIHFAHGSSAGTADRHFRHRGAGKSGRSRLCRPEPECRRRAGRRMERRIPRDGGRRSAHVDRERGGGERAGRSGGYPDRRSLDVHRPVQYGDAGFFGESFFPGPECRRGAQACGLSADPALQLHADPPAGAGGAADGRGRFRLAGLQCGDGGGLFGLRLLFRPAAAEGPRCSDRPDRHGLGRHRHRRMDLPGEIRGGALAAVLRLSGRAGAHLEYVENG